jgi:hypothetical protein
MHSKECPEEWGRGRDVSQKDKHIYFHNSPFISAFSEYIDWSDKFLTSESELAIKVQYSTVLILDCN